MRIARSLLVFPVWLLVACGQGKNTTPDLGDAVVAPRPLEVYTVNYPLAWAAQQLVEEWGEVHFPVPPQVDPASWQPDEGRVAAYQQADLIFLNGANYARWLSRVSLPDNRLVDTSREFTDQLITLDSGPVHSHGPKGDHSHGDVAFTVWLDLSFYDQQIQAVAKALARKVPQELESISARAQNMTAQIAGMDRELIKLGREFNGAPLLYSHPVYQYFGRRYHFNGRALHWEPQEFPTPEDWSKLNTTLEQHPAALMLWEGEPLAETREKLKKMGVEVVVFRPMGNRPPQGDFLTEMSANIERLRTYLGGT